MSERELQGVVQALSQTLDRSDYSQVPKLLQKAKQILFSLDAIVPSPDTPAGVFKLAQETLELGAFVCIRLKDTDGFTRFFQLLQPFYELQPIQAHGTGKGKSTSAENRSKVTGLYLLLLLSNGDYAAFHTQLETLEVAQATDGSAANFENDRFIQYPIKLEQWLMEGSYDKVWNAAKSEQAPSQEYALFSEVRYLAFSRGCLRLRSST
jgi:26S proteasome regulatory subunit N12